MSESLLIRVGLAIVSAAVEFARGLTGKVDPVALKQRAERYFDEARSDLAAAEERERASFGDP